ncbi:MAG: DUF5916 domain-containing protein [Flavobacteriaceae bacterium]
MARAFYAFALFLLWFPAVSQTTNKSFTVKYISETITADGILDEAVWAKAESAHNFWEYFPTDDIQAKQPSEIKMLYDDDNLYIGIKVNATGSDYAIQSLKRDFRAGSSDNISLLFDTFNDGTNAFLFGTNPYGVRREGLVSGGGNSLRGFSTTWDVKWQGETVIYDDYYISELIIPLTSFKFKEGETKWRFNSYRFDTQSNETSTWIQIPKNQNVFGLAFMGDMIFENPLGKSRTPLAVIPYVNTISQKDFETGDGLAGIKVGGDIKVAIGSSMNLDITINPDFSQVEVDDQVTNLTRFEVSLPEKRQFFVDNSDLFSSYGDQFNSNPFFSRRIGIAQDTAGNSIENKILGGVRLSGKITKDLRLGLLNIQTEADEANEIGANNNMMMAIQQKVFSRSTIGLFFINRQSTKDYDFIDPEDTYNRVLGADYHLITKDNTWDGGLFMHKSFSHGKKGHNISTGGRMNYNSRNYKAYAKLVHIDEDFRSDLGFVRRTDILKSFVYLERVFWPERGLLQSHGFQFSPSLLWKPSDHYRNTDYKLKVAWKARFRNSSQAMVQIDNTYIYLYDSFDPTNKEDAVPLPGNLGYHYNNVGLEYQSDRRKLFAYKIESSIGRFFNGKRFSIKSMMTLRFQPKVFLSLLTNYDKISLPAPHSSADIWLISPKVDITFSKTIYWSSLVQYSNQRDNLGFNSRIQWRFAPLSDLFIVYNDNYFVNSFMPKNRSINLKFTYWLTI